MAGLKERPIEGGSRQVVVISAPDVDPMWTTSGELWTTETERESDVWTQYSNTFNSTAYVIVISKDNLSFPHRRQGQGGSRIDVTSIYYAVDLAASTSAIIRFGVITRIDGVNADIKYFGGIPFLTGAAQDTLIQSLRGVPSQVKLDFDDSGTLLHGATNTVENNVAGVNTGITLDSPVGTIAPGLGDVILKYEHSGGSSDMAIFFFYHNTD